MNEYLPKKTVRFSVERLFKTVIRTMVSLKRQEITSVVTGDIVSSLESGLSRPKRKRDGIYVFITEEEMSTIRS